MHRYLDAGFHRYTFRRSFYGLVHFYALLHKQKATRAGGFLFGVLIKDPNAAAFVVAQCAAM